MWHGASLADACDCAQEAMTEAIGCWSDLTHPYSWCHTFASRTYLRRTRELERWPDDPVGTGAEPAAPDALAADRQIGGAVDRTARGEPRCRLRASRLCLGSHDNDVWSPAMSEDSSARRTRRPTEHDRGLAEGARLWARMQGLPVPARGEVPPIIVRQYRQRTAPN
jgi:hypothetical protein